MSWYHCAELTKARLPKLKAYYQQRLGWDHRTFQTVDDWDLFGRVFPKMHKRRNFLTKFCCYNLPTGDRLHRRHTSYDDCCPTCHAPDETDDHILQCPSPPCHAWRSDLLDTLLKPLDKFVDSVLLDILREGLLRFFRDEHLDPTQYSPHYQRLLKQQAAIGWNNFL